MWQSVFFWTDLWLLGEPRMLFGCVRRSPNCDSCHHAAASVLCYSFLELRWSSRSSAQKTHHRAPFVSRSWATFLIWVRVCMPLSWRVTSLLVGRRQASPLSACSCQEVGRPLLTPTRKVFRSCVGGLGGHQRGVLARCSTVDDLQNSGA